MKITIDIDWAPDWAIARCYEMCRDAGLPCTFFATHESDILADLRAAGPTVEIGIHPNLIGRSNTPLDYRHALDEAMGVVPEAVSMRTHSLVQSTPFFHLLLSHYPVETDVSLLLPFQEGLRPAALHLGMGDRFLTRLPYWFEDDIVATWPGWRWEPPKRS